MSIKDLVVGEKNRHRDRHEANSEGEPMQQLRMNFQGHRLAQFLTDISTGRPSQVQGFVQEFN